MGDIWLRFVFAGVPFDVRGVTFVVLFFFFCVRCCPLGALLRNILGFLIHVCVAVDTICMTHGAVTYLVVIPRFPVVRGRVFFFFLFVVWCFSFCCVSFSLFFFFLTRTCRLAPMARTLLGGSALALFFSSSSWLAGFWCSPLFFFFVCGARTSP